MRRRSNPGKTAAGMTSLAKKLTADDVRPQVVQACVQLVEAQVAAKRGLSGMAIKAGFKVIKALKPGMVADTVNTLLPEFASSLQEIYAKTAENSGDKSEFTSYLTGNSDEAADALLKVTDGRAERAKNRTIKKTYDRLRGTAKSNVREAVPGLARALEKFL